MTCCRWWCFCTFSKTQNLAEKYFFPIMRKYLTVLPLYNTQTKGNGKSWLQWSQIESVRLVMMRRKDLILSAKYTFFFFNKYITIYFACHVTWRRNNNFICKWNSHYIFVFCRPHTELWVRLKHIGQINRVAFSSATSFNI